MAESLSPRKLSRMGMNCFFLETKKEMRTQKRKNPKKDREREKEKGKWKEP